MSFYARILWLRAFANTLGQNETCFVNCLSTWRVFQLFTKSHSETLNSTVGFTQMSILLCLWISCVSSSSSSSRGVAMFVRRSDHMRYILFFSVSNQISIWRSRQWSSAASAQGLLPFEVYGVVQQWSKLTHIALRVTLCWSISGQRVVEWRKALKRLCGFVFGIRTNKLSFKLQFVGFIMESY